MLTKSFQKHQKYFTKKLVKANKVSTFAPATAIDVHRNTGKKENQNEKKFSNKNSKKACENGKRILHLHPAKYAKLIERLEGER
ncbi:hypothetical protein, partial [Flavobacterium sp. T12S277]|uniref:hypothetical protein n=1 Tax=Flavobacterium sp. T12S277 TaxID=3402752 RepID=UPI003AE5F2BA